MHSRNGRNTNQSYTFENLEENCRDSIIEQCFAKHNDKQELVDMDLFKHSNNSYLNVEYKTILLHAAYRIYGTY